ncbi:MAG: hypothetical protein COU22_02870, partial [Candidatus Komeilibacteria bacterium CG10_big_fil_rev_8_21_14_0_10_41_13]
MFKSSKLILAIVIFTLVFNLLFFGPLVKKAQAQLDAASTAATIAQTVNDIVQWVKDGATYLYEESLRRAWAVMWRNALRTFLSRLAYQTATWIAEGDVGKKPLFHTSTFGEFVAEVGEVTLVDTLDILAKDNGFVSFDICEPKDLDLKLAIQYSLFNERAGRGAPRCTLSEIATSWGDWADSVGRTYSSEKFLDTFRNSFSPTEAPVGIYLSLNNQLS